MNTNLLALSNIFAGINGTGLPAKPTAAGKSERSSPHPLDNPFTNSLGTETADNNNVNTYKSPDKEPSQEFEHTLSKEVTTNVTKKADNSSNTKKQNQTSGPVVQPSIIQAWLAQYSLNAEHGKEGVAKKVEPKAGYELAQLLTKLKGDGFPSGSGKTAKPHEITLPLTIDQNQIGLKTASANTSTAPLATRGPTNQQSGKGLTLKSLVDAQNGTNTTDEKPAITGKLDVHSGRKVPTSDPDSLPVQDEYSYLQSQPVRISPEKSSFIDEKTTGKKTTSSQQGSILLEPSVDNKAAVHQSSHPGTKLLSEPPEEESVEQGHNLQGNPSSQKLHLAQFQITSDQTKDRGSSVSSNNSDSGFKQILSPDNLETFVAEQTSAFSEGSKADNLPTQTSPSNVSASITEQILESIHSTSPQRAGTQEITIRLNPPEMGKVFIKFVEQENQITGLLEVSKAQTRYEVEQALPHIIQNLSDSGIQIKRLEVVLTDQGEQQPYRDELLQDGTFQQEHDFSEGGNPDNNGTIGTNELITGVDSSSYQNSFEPQMQITDNSIDMLI